jgi:ligand-binding sensor domain-containing protein
MLNLIKLSLLTFIVMLSSFCKAQQIEFKIKNYDEATGLSNRKISSVLQDAKGFLWVATADGLNRFDGYNFKIFKKTLEDSAGILGNNITALAEDKNHNIWIGLATGGIGCYHPSSGKFINYPFTQKHAAIAGEVNMMYIDKNNSLWFGVKGKGLVYLNAKNGTFTNFDLLEKNDTLYAKELRSNYNTVYAAAENGDGMLWLATHNGLYKINIDRPVLYSVREKPLVRNAFRNDLFTAILFDKKDGIWLSSWAGGISYYHTKTNIWKNYKYDKEHPNSETKNIVTSLQLKNNAQLWVTSMDKGLGLFDMASEHFFFFSDQAAFHPNIPAKLCYGALKDKENGIWIWHKGGLTQMQQGIKKFPFKPFAVTHSDNGEFYELTAMLEDKDGEHTYIGTSFADGFHVLEKSSGKHIQLPFKFMPNEEKFLLVTDIIQDSKGIIWVLTRDYIYQYNKQTNKLQLPLQPSIYSAAYPSNRFTKLAEDKQGNIWIASSLNGVFCYSKTTNTYTHYTNQTNNKKSLASNIIKCMAVDVKGNIWLGSNREGLSIFNAAENNFTNFYPNQNNGLVSTHITSLAADSKGNMWVGTDIGLHKFDANGSKPIFKKLYTSKSGLNADFIFSIKEDAYGNIWCISPVSLGMINTQTDAVKNFTGQDMVVKNDIGLGLLQTQAKKIIMLAAGGYYEFDPASFKEDRKPISVVVTSLKVLDQERFFEDELLHNNVVDISYKENIFSFDFTALDFTRSNKIQYAYMLENFDKDWVYAGNRHYVGYTNIPGGKYLFKIKATTDANHWGTSFTSIPIYVNTPFYKTIWFVLFNVIATLSIIYFIYRYRLLQHQAILKLATKAQALEKEKTQVQYENLKQHLNPHFLFNTLTSLSGLIRTDQKLAINFLDGMSKIYRYILQSKDNETIALKEEIKFIDAFIQLQKTRFQNGLIVNMNIDEEVVHRKIVPVTLQNLIENAIKHNIVDEDSPLVIDIYIDDDYLVVKNNLQKKKFVDTSNKQGLESLQSLYKYLSDKPFVCEEANGFYVVKIPLI